MIKCSNRTLLDLPRARGTPARASLQVERPMILLLALWLSYGGTVIPKRSKQIETTYFGAESVYI